MISLPHLVPEFPLIQNFVRITPSTASNSPHELYVFHRHGLLSSNFKVRKAVRADVHQVGAVVVVALTAVAWPHGPCFDEELTLKNEK